MLRIAGILLATTLGLTFIGGCAAQSSSTSYMNGKLPSQLTKASSAGTYGLFAQDGTSAFSSVMLQKGDEYGFKRVESGEVVGFVQYLSGETKKISLQTWLADGYYWKFVGNKK